MKLKHKIHFAYIMSKQRKYTYYISIILLALSLFISGLLVYEYKINNDYGERVQAGCGIDINKLYYFSNIDFNNPVDTSTIEGISDVYYWDSYASDSPELNFLKKIQQNHVQDSSIAADENAIEIWQINDDYCIDNIKLVSGREPEDISDDCDSLLYLSEKYEGLVDIGDHYYDYNSDGDVKWNYLIAGFFSADSAGLDYSVYDELVGTGYVPLDYGILEVMKVGSADDGYFYVKDGYDEDTVLSEILDAGASYISIADNIKNLVRDSMKGVKYLVLAAVLLCLTSVVILLIIQTNSVLSGAKDFGVLLTGNVKNKDIRDILSLQNIIKLVLALVISMAVICLFILKLLYPETLVESAIADKIVHGITFLWVFPAMTVMGVLITFLSTLIPMIKLNRTASISLVKGDIDFKKNFLARIIVAAVIFISMVANMTVSNLLDKFAESKINKKTVDEMTYSEIGISCGISDGDGSADAKFFPSLLDEGIPEFEGNVFLVEVFSELNGGGSYPVSVALALNENLPYTEEILNDEGVYLGDGYGQYVDGNELNLFNDDYVLKGFLKNNTLGDNNEIIIPYELLSDVSKIYLSACLDHGEIALMFESDMEGVVERDIDKANEWLKNNSYNELLHDEDNFISEYVEEEKQKGATVFKKINNILNVITMAYCILAVFEAVRLLLNRKKEDILVLWALGSKKKVIFEYIFKIVTLPIVWGTLVALAFEVLIYGVMMNYSVGVFMKYAAISCICVIVIVCIMILTMISMMIRKPIIQEIKGDE